MKTTEVLLIVGALAAGAYFLMKKGTSGPKYQVDDFLKNSSMPGYNFHIMNVGETTYLMMVTFPGLQYLYSYSISEVDNSSDWYKV